MTILDGADAGTRAVTLSGGGFAFQPLAAGTFTVQAAADSHTSLSRSITIAAADVAVDFVLLRADLVLEGLLTYEALAPPNDTWRFNGNGLNRGDTCAVNVTGHLSRVDDEGEPLEGQTRSFALPASTVVHPSERFRFTGCCFTRMELDGPPFVRAEFAFQSIACS